MPAQNVFISTPILGDALELLNNHQFSTFDKDNDDDLASCANLFAGGWWFDCCTGMSRDEETLIYSNLNGEYYIQQGDYLNQEYRGIRWNPWKGRKIVKTEMKIRRNRNDYQN